MPYGLSEGANYGAKSGLGRGFGAGLGGIASGLYGLFGNQRNPADEANGYISQIPGATQGYYDPYIQHGQHAGNQLQGQYDQLLNDPGGKYNSIGNSFHESPGFKFALQQALGSSNNQNAAGGMSGTPANTQQNMQLATDLANQDYYNYMGGATGLYGKGLEGSQGMYNTGYNASNSQANNVAQALAQQGAYAYQGQQAKNDRRNQAFGDLAGGIGSMFF